jgi:hypothetical protein
MNDNTVIGLYNLPVKTIGVNTEIVLTVPASGNGPASSYPGLPSPTLPVGSAISIGLDDRSGSYAFDGHPFVINVAGVVSNPGTGVFTCTLYQLAAAQIGQIGAAAPVTALGAPGTGCASLGTLVNGVALNTTAGGQFRVTSTFLWDSVTGILGQVEQAGFWNLATTTTAIAAGAGTCLQVGASMLDLNFMLTFTFATADPANKVTVKEFEIKRR